MAGADSTVGPETGTPSCNGNSCFFTIKDDEEGRSTVKVMPNSGCGMGPYWADLLETPVHIMPRTERHRRVSSTMALRPGFNTPKPRINGVSVTDQARAFAEALISGWTVENWYCLGL